MMNGKELNKSLREMTISCGLCQQWQGEWKNDWDLDRMISQFYRGIDFFINKRYMSDKFMKENFDMAFRRKNGVLVDDEHSLLNPSNAVLIGNSKSTIRMNGHCSSTIYILDSADAKIIAKGNAFAMVHVHGCAKVEVLQKDESKVVVIRHSINSEIISDDNITIREKMNSEN